MKKLILLLGFIFLSLYFFKTIKPKPMPVVMTRQTPSPKVTNNPGVSSVIPKNSEGSPPAIFIPYWKTSQLDGKISIPNITNLTNEEIKPIYFGLSVDENGLMKDEIGFKNLPQFISNFDSKPMAITIRMLNDDTNIKILKNPDSQNNIINSLGSLLTQYPFSELILDLELKSLSTERTIDQINKFVKKVADETHRHDRVFSMTIYGDIFYRQRPFDIQNLNGFTDRF